MVQISSFEVGFKFIIEINIIINEENKTNFSFKLLLSKIKLNNTIIINIFIKFDLSPIIKEIIKNKKKQISKKNLYL